MSDSSDGTYTPLPVKTIEEAARNLVNAIADMVHATIVARAAAVAEAQAGVSVKPTEAVEEVNDQSEVRSLEYNADDRAKDEEDIEREEREEMERQAREEAEARAEREREEAEERAAQEAIEQAALAAVDRRVPNGQRVSLAGQGRGRTYGEGALPQGQFYIRGAKISFPDSLRTAIATIFREEPAVESLFDLTLDGDQTVMYRAVRGAGSRQIILTCNRFRQEIVMTMDDLAEEEVPM
jgi:multidrug efflux pump subunit AcrA (membrane-fusion protein)